MRTTQSGNGAAAGSPKTTVAPSSSRAPSTSNLAAAATAPQMSRSASISNPAAAEQKINTLKEAATKAFDILDNAALRGETEEKAAKPSLAQLITHVEENLTNTVLLINNLQTNNLLYSTTLKGYNDILNNSSLDEGSTKIYKDNNTPISLNLLSAAIYHDQHQILKALLDVHIVNTFVVELAEAAEEEDQTHYQSLLTSLQDNNSGHEQRGKEKFDELTSKKQLSAEKIKQVLLVFSPETLKSAAKYAVDSKDIAALTSLVQAGLEHLPDNALTTAIDQNEKPTLLENLLHQCGEMEIEITPDKLNSAAEYAVKSNNINAAIQLILVGATFLKPESQSAASETLASADSDPMFSLFKTTIDKNPALLGNVIEAFKEMGVAIPEKIKSAVSTHAVDTENFVALSAMILLTDADPRKGEGVGLNAYDLAKSKHKEKRAQRDEAAAKLKQSKKRNDSTAAATPIENAKPTAVPADEKCYVIVGACALADDAIFLGPKQIAQSVKNYPAGIWRRQVMAIEAARWEIPFLINYLNKNIEKIAKNVQSNSALSSNPELSDKQLISNLISFISQIAVLFLKPNDKEAENLQSTALNMIIAFVKRVFVPYHLAIGAISISDLALVSNTLNSAHILNEMCGPPIRADFLSLLKVVNKDIHDQLAAQKSSVATADRDSKHAATPDGRSRVTSTSPLSPQVPQTPDSRLASPSPSLASSLGSPIVSADSLQALSPIRPASESAASPTPTASAPKRTGTPATIVAASAPTSGADNSKNDEKIATTSTAAASPPSAPASLGGSSASISATLTTFDSKRDSNANDATSPKPNNDSKHVTQPSVGSSSNGLLSSKLQKAINTAKAANDAATRAMVTAKDAKDTADQAAAKAADKANAAAIAKTAADAAKGTNANGTTLAEAKNTSAADAAAKAVATDSANAAKAATKALEAAVQAATDAATAAEKAVGQATADAKAPNANAAKAAEVVATQAATTAKVVADAAKAAADKVASRADADAKTVDVAQAAAKNAKDAAVKAPKDAAAQSAVKATGKAVDDVIKVSKASTADAKTAADTATKAKAAATKATDVAAKAKAAVDAVTKADNNATVSRTTTSSLGNGSNK